MELFVKNKANQYHRILNVGHRPVNRNDLDLDFIIREHDILSLAF